MALPAAVEYGQVYWTGIGASADGADVDGLPDALGVTGTVTFKPSPTEPLTANPGAAEAVSVFPLPAPYDIVGGVLQDSQGRTLISLLATTAADVSPVGWTWLASYRLNPVAGASVTRGSFSFSLAPGEVLNLANAMPVTSSNGVAIVKGDKGDPGNSGPIADATVAGFVGDNDSATTMSLRAAYGTPKDARTFVLLGNSRIELEEASGSTRQYGAFTWANTMMRHRAKVLNHAGVGADTLTGMIARFAADVAAYNPASVLIADAINDITLNNATFSDCYDRYLTLIGKCRAIGARTILLTTPPKDTATAAQRGVVGAINHWLKSLTDPDILVIDVAAPVVAASGMTWATGMSTDGLHQSRRGAYRQGKVIAAALDPLLRGTDPLPSTAGYSGNAVANPLINGTAGAGIPTGWEVYPAQGTGVTYSIVARADQGPGNWFQIDNTAGADPAFATATGSLSGVAATGDSIEAVLEFQADSGWTYPGQIQMYLQVLDAGGAQVTTALYALAHFGDTAPFPEEVPATSGSWVFRTLPVEVPATATQAKLFVEFSGRGKLRIGRASIRKAI